MASTACAGAVRTVGCSMRVLETRSTQNVQRSPASSFVPRQLVRSSCAANALRSHVSSTPRRQARRAPGPVRAVADVDEDAVRTVADELGGDEEWDEDIPKMFPETSGKRPRQPRKNEQKIKIKLRSYWVPRIEEATNQIMEAAKTTETKAAGPIRLPTRRRKWTVLTSPHVNKDAREQFELRTHRRLIELINPTAQAVDALMQLNLPAGVDVQVKLS